MLARARERLGAQGQRTILFLDEIHRFNKAQQDALLPAVEEGLVTLIGATTENPYFEVNSALMSRMQLYTLEPLSDEEMTAVVAPRRGAPGRVRRGRAGSADRPACRRRRALGAEHPRAGSPDRRGRGRAGHRGARRGRGPEAPARVRPHRRPALRLRVGVHQVDARLRPRCGRLLPRGDARGGRGSALRCAAHGHPRLRGRRRRRLSSARRRGRRRAGPRARRASRSAAQPGAGRDLPRQRAQVQRRRPRPVGGDEATSTSTATCARRRSSATPAIAGRRSSATARATSTRTRTRRASRSTTCRTS